MILRTKVGWGHFLLYSILVCGLVYILTSAFNGYYAFSYDVGRIIRISLIVSTVLYVYYRYNITSLIIIGLTSSGLLAYCFVKKLSIIKYVLGLWHAIYYAIWWFAEYAYSIAEIDIVYSNIMVFSFVMLISIILAFFVILLRNTVVPFCLGVISLSVMWIMGYAAALDFLKQYVFVIFIIYCSANLHGLTAKWRLRKDAYSPWIWLTWAASVLCTIAVVFTVIKYLPPKIKSVEYSLWKSQAFKKVRDLWSGGGSVAASAKSINGKFSVSSVGFQEGPTRLGGAVKMANMPLLKVKVDEDIKTPIYLRGTVKNYYTGSMWTKRETLVFSVGDNDAILNLYGNTSRVKETKAVGMTIYPVALDMSTIFNIWKPYRADIQDESFYYDSDGELYLADESDKNKEYRVAAIVPVVYSDDLRKSLVTNNSESLKKYLQLPRNLPQRVKDLAKEAAGGKNNNYDKAIAIQEYLRSNHPYTLETTNLPPQRDFVDYFLFDEKKGYCTYFASAMAVMSRAVGIPSRYVEGVVLDSTDIDSEGYFNVMSNKAHAWVELYFEGYGWVRFEPTSNYTEPNFIRPPEITPTPAAGYVPTETNDSETPSRNNDPDELLGSSPIKLDIPLNILIPVLVIILTLIRIAVKHYAELSRLRKAERLKGREAAMAYFAILEDKLSQGGLAREKGETAREFGQRIQQSLEPYGVDSVEIMEAFDRIRFGNFDIDDNVRGRFKDAIDSGEKLVKSKRGITKYYIRKYIF